MQSAVFLPPNLSDVSSRNASSGRTDSVTLEDVKKAAEKLGGLGLPVTLRSLHSEVGRGSRSTIHKHWTVIQGRVPISEKSDEPVLPAQVARGLAAEMDRLITERSRNLADQLFDVKASLDLVVEENETLRRELADAYELLASARVSLAEQVGNVNAIQSQRDSLEKQLGVATREIEKEHLSFAIAQEQLKAAVDRHSLYKEKQEEIEEELSTVRQQLLQAQDYGRNEKNDLINLRVRIATTEQTESELRQLKEKLPLLHNELESVRIRLSACDAERIGLSERLIEAKTALERADARLEKVLAKLLETPGASVHEGGSENVL